MRRIPKPVLFIALSTAAAGGVFLFTQWKAAVSRGGQTAAEPFRIAGNFYYVGASDVAMFLVTGPAGHVLIDAGYQGNTPLVLESIRKLGFDIRDVKIIFNTDPHSDHAGGSAALQKASGAELWTSEHNADVIEAGGANDDDALLLRILGPIGQMRYAETPVNHRVKDGDTIRLGPIALTARLTGGHSRGCTTLTFTVRDSSRTFNVVDACDLELQPGVHLADPQQYPGIRDDYERTFRVLRGLPVDIWVTSHARAFGRYRKFVASSKAGDPVEPFIDRDGFKAYVDSGEARFRRKLEEQQKK